MLFPFSKIYHDGSFSSCVIPILVLSLRKKKKQWQKMYRFWHWSSLLSKMDVGLTRIYLVLRNCSSLYTSNQFPSPFFFLFLQERRSFFSFSFFFSKNIPDKDFRMDQPKSCISNDSKYTKRFNSPNDDG